MALVRFFVPFSLCLILSATCACTDGRKPAESVQPDSGAKSDPAVTNPAPAPPRDERPLIATFGDSLSAGYGADPGESYPDYLQKLLDQSHKNYRVLNAGVSGDTTTDGLERLPGILASTPKIVILEFGGNDGLRGLPPKTTEANLEKIIVALQGAGSKVILAGMTLPRNYGKDYIGQFEHVYVDLANRYHLTRIPFLLQGVAGNASLMQPDSIHPTGEGNKKVADTVFGYLKPQL